MFSELFAEDGEWTDVFGYLMNSKAEIERMHVFPFTTVLKDAVLTVRSMHFRAIKPDILSIDLKWESTGNKTPEGMPLPTRNGLINIIAVQSGHG